MGTEVTGGTWKQPLWPGSLKLEAPNGPYPLKARNVIETSSNLRFETENIFYRVDRLKEPNELAFFSFKMMTFKNQFMINNRQGNMANKLANCVKATKISGMIHINILFRSSLGDFFLIDRKLINYSWLLINFKML